MPRQSKLLPYVRLTRHGRLQYFRRVPPEHRHSFENRGSFTVVLDVDPSKPSSKAAHVAWAAANAEYERLLAAEPVAITPDSTDELSVTPLRPRDIAGLAAEPLLQLLKAGNAGQITQKQAEDLAAIVAIATTGAEWSVSTGDTAPLLRAKELITQGLVGDLLKQLHITPDSTAMQAIQDRLIQYSKVAGADAAKIEEGDFSAGELERIAPPLPQSQVTYDDLIQQWLLDAGGLRVQTGIGVSQKRYQHYERVIAELIQQSGKHFPAEMNVADARRYINWLQQGSLAIRSKQQRITCISNLFGIGVRFGLLNSNPFVDMRIKTPKNVRQQSYRSFTAQELVDIMEILTTSQDKVRVMLVKLLLVTGARSSDISMLRYQDIKRTDRGVWYLDLVDEPNHKFPHSLKGGSSDERRTPLHPWVIKQGFLDYYRSDGEGYIFGTQDDSALSSWFKRILMKLGIYEKRVTVLHSMRGTWIDLMREARLPEDVRRAVTGHSSRDVQDRVYGAGLEKMPDVLYKELKKIDLSWLP